MLPAIKYLLSDDATGDADAASCFCYVLEDRLKCDPDALGPIASVVQYAITKILSDFDRFDCCPEIYRNVPARYREVAARLAP